MKAAKNVQPIGVSNSDIDDPPLWPIMNALNQNHKYVIVLSMSDNGEVSWSSNTTNKWAKLEMIEKMKIGLLS